MIGFSGSALFPVNGSKKIIQPGYLAKFSSSRKDWGTGSTMQKQEHWFVAIMPSDKNPLFNTTQLYLYEGVDPGRCLNEIVVPRFPLQKFMETKNSTPDEKKKQEGKE